jgi:hypothetical protein
MVMPVPSSPLRFLPEVSLTVGDLNRDIKGKIPGLIPA